MRQALAAVLALAALAPRTAAAAPAEAEFVRLSLPVDGSLVEARFLDLDGDGDRDLALSLLPSAPGSRREVRLFAQGEDGLFPTQPGQTVRVPEDAIACALADVRAEPGKELVFLARGGAWSLSPTRPGYRDNVRRLATQDLLFQVPSPQKLNFWSYVVEREGGDLLLLPGGAGVALWGPRDAPAAEGADDYRSLADWGGDGRALGFSVKAPGALVVTSGGARVSLDTGESEGLFLREAPAAFAAMLQADAHYRAPALVDVDGDGRLDLLLRKDDALHVHLADGHGMPEEPTRQEPLPEWLAKPDTDLILHLADLDGDGDIDVLARQSPEHVRLEAATFTYFVLLNDGARLIPDQPHQVLRFEGNGTDSEITDVDGDGRADLVVTKYVLPTLTDLVTGFRLVRGAYVYLAGQGKDPFGRKPALRDEQSFTLESLQDALVVRRIPGDLSGDGVADLVEVDLTGRVVVRRIEQAGSREWRLSADSWKRFDLGADLSRLSIEDVNGDGLQDLVNPRSGALELVLSRRGGGR